MSTTTDSHRRAAQLKAQLDNRFFKKGLTVAILSGICYGLYTAFMTLGMARGVWIPWMSAETVLSLFVVTYILSAMGSALNDTCSAIWCLIIAAMKGKLGDFFRTLRTKPGIVMICAALGSPAPATSSGCSRQARLPYQSRRCVRRLARSLRVCFLSSR